MHARIFSRVVRRSVNVAAITASVVLVQDAAAQNTGQYVDESTGIVYRQVTRTIEKPVVETKIEQREQTVYRPQTITETKPEARTVYTPVVEYQWQPRLEGRWNPFRQPTVAYQHVPTTRWEARNEIVNRTSARTQWVAETRTVDVPQQLVRMEREQKVEYEAVAKVAAQPTIDAASAQIASRLRPLAANTPIQPLAPTIPSSAYSSPRIASSSVGRMTSDPPRRSLSQSGMRSNDLIPSSPAGHGQALPPTASTGVAGLPLPTFLR